MFNTALLMKGSSSSAFYPTDIPYSMLLDGSSDYLSWTPGVAASSSQQLICHFIFKRTTLGANQGVFSAVQGANTDTIYIDSSDRLYISLNNGADGEYISTMVFRDVSSFYHLTVSFDTGNATAGDRIRAWVEDEEITDWTTETHATLNYDFAFVENGVLNTIGARADTALKSNDYIAQVILLDGQTSADPPSLFGETKSGVWVYNPGTLTYGTNGFHLDFSSDSPNLGDDVSGNGNDFTEAGSPVQTTDTPTNNFAVLNRLAYKFTSATLSKGNLYAYMADAYTLLPSTLEMTSGSWYCEIEMSDTNYSNFVGIVNGKVDMGLYVGGGSDGWGLYTVNGNKYHAGSSAYGAACGIGSIVMIAWDHDTGSLYFGKDGLWCDGSGSFNQTWENAVAAYTGIDEPGIRFAISCSSTSGVTVNFGNPQFSITSGNTDENGYGNFEYAPPSGFLALCSANIAKSLSILDSIDSPSEAVYVNERAGTSDTTKAIADVEFDVSAGALVVVKNTGAASMPWQVSDTERGVDKQIFFDSNLIEQSYTDRITAFSSSGFTVGNSATVNWSGHTFLDWVLREGADYGFDIVLDTGTGVAHTINHNLGVVPSLIIRDNLDYSLEIIAYHSLVASDPETDYGQFSDVAAFADDVAVWNDTAPTSTGFTVGTYNGTNRSGDDFVTYLFADIPGLCKAFAYTGNGNADGPYIPLGFRAGFAFIKNVSVAGTDWTVRSTKLNTYNLADTYGYLDDVSIAFITGSAPQAVDICSHGIKIRGTSGLTNSSGVLYIGFAWAEQFGCYANAR